MSRRNRLVSTYGRHKQRVVSTETDDVFTAHQKEQKKSVFSSFSSSGSQSHSGSQLESIEEDSSIFSPKNQKKLGARGLRNQVRRKCLADISNTTDSNPSDNRHGEGKSSDEGRSVFTSFDEEDNKEFHRIQTQKTNRTRANTEYSKISDDCAGSCANHVATRVNPPAARTANNTIDSSNGDGMNFSEFEKYSLIISDSGPDIHSVPPTPEIEGNSIEKSQNSDAFTSTPHALRLKPTMSLYNSLIRDSDISHIDIIEDSPQPVASRTRAQLSMLADTSLNYSVDTHDERAKQISKVSKSIQESETNSHMQDVSASLQFCVGAVEKLSLLSKQDQSEFSACDDDSKCRFRTYDVSSRFPLLSSNIVHPIIPTPSKSTAPAGESFRVDSKCINSNLNTTVDSCVQLERYLDVSQSDCNDKVSTPVKDDRTETVMSFHGDSVDTRKTSNGSNSYEMTKSMFSSYSPSAFVDTKSGNQIQMTGSLGDEDNTRLPYGAKDSFHDTREGSFYAINVDKEENKLTKESEIHDSLPAHDELGSQPDLSENATELYSYNEVPETTGNILELHSSIDAIPSDTSSHSVASHDPSVSSVKLICSHSSISTIDDISESRDVDISAASEYKSTSKYFSCDSHLTKKSESSASDADTSMDNSITKRRKPKNKRLQDLDSSCRSITEFLTPVKSRKSGFVISPKDKLLMLCNQSDPVPFSEAIPTTMMRKCVKIGEGVYGEVFRTQRNRDSVAIKIVPIEGDFTVNDEPQKSYAEMIPEVVISKELSDLSENYSHNTENFVKVNGLSVVKGSYPDKLLKEWDSYHSRKISENDRPEVFGDDQQFIVFEFEDAGCDLESFPLESFSQARSIIYQVTCSLAIAEVALQFEHRDLHWGNVLVKDTLSDTLWYKLDGQEFGIETHGVKVSIIDFTLSRLTKDGCSVFTDLSEDPTLFQGQGDYQFEVYRLMKEENQNNWKPHNPYTNVLWIYYVADKLLNAKTYKKTRTKDHKSMGRSMRTFVREILDYRSAQHLLRSCPFFTESE